jgi:SnoaL-like domain
VASPQEDSKISCGMSTGKIPGRSGDKDRAGAHNDGQRYVGKAEVRKGLATRFEGIPDVHYGDDENWVSGNQGVSRWALTGTTKDGKKINVRGCDLLEFRDGKIVRKDSYWKIVEPKRWASDGRSIGRAVGVPRQNLICTRQLISVLLLAIVVRTKHATVKQRSRVGPDPLYRPLSTLY